MFGHCRQPSGIAAGSAAYAGITSAGNLRRQATARGPAPPPRAEGSFNPPSRPG